MARDLRVGDVVRERFRLTDVLGSGSSGVVFAAHDHQSGEDLALKTLHGLRAEQRYRLKQEFRLRRVVEHEGLVRLFELVDGDDISFFTMELVRGRDFVRFARADTPGDAPLPGGLHGGLREAGQRLLAGVAAMHAHQRIHRDIKPSNTLVTDHGRAVLLDFGLVRSMDPDHSHSQHDFVGTLAYAAPEQMLATEAPASDLYSVGVMLFEALTGARPFVGSSLELLMSKQRGLSDEQKAALPADFRDLVCGLLEPTADARWDVHRANRALSLGGADGLVRHTPSLFSASRSVFVGRASELALLAEVVQRVSDGEPHVVRIQGPSGIGKTELVLELERRLGGSNAILLHSRSRLDETVAYRAVDPIIDRISSVLARDTRDARPVPVPRHAAAMLRVFPVLERVPELAKYRAREPGPTHQDVRRQAFVGLGDLLAFVSERGPLILWIDDAQWGDTDSATLLRAVMQHGEGQRWLLLLTYRDAATDGFVERVSRLPPHVKEHDVHLGALSREEARELALELAIPNSREIETIAREAEGSPFFVSQLVRHWQRGTGSEQNLELSSETLVIEQLSALPPAWREVVELVAVANAPTEIAMLARLVEAARPRDWLPQLATERLLREVGGDGGMRVEIYHDRIRDVILARQQPERARELNRRIARDVEAHLDVLDLRDLVRYWQSADDRQRASAHALEAAQRAEARLAFDRAAKLYGIALSHAPAQACLSELTEKHAYVVACSGRGAEAAAIYEQAAEHARKEGRSALDVLRLRRLAVERYLRSGHLTRGNRLLRELLRDLDLPFPATVVHTAGGIAKARAQLFMRSLPTREATSLPAPRELERIHTLWTATVGLTWADNLRSTYFQVRHALAAFDAKPALPLVRALASEACYVAVPGGARARRQSVAATEAALAMAERLGDPEMRAVAMVCGAGASFLRGEWRRAIGECDAAEKVIVDECPGADWERANCHIFGQWALCFVGDIARLAEALPGHIEQARARDDELAACYMGVGLPNLLFLVHDEPEEAARVGSEAVGRWRTNHYSPLHFFDLVGQIHADLYRGRADSARERWASQARRLALSLLTQNQVIRGLAKYTEACVLIAENANPPVRRVRKLIHDLEKEDAEWCRALGQTAKAALVWHVGDRQEGLSLLAIAERALEQTSLGLFAAAAFTARDRATEGHRPIPPAFDRAARPERLAWALLPWGPFAP